MSSILASAVEEALAEKDRQARTANYLWDFKSWYEYMTGGQLWSKQIAIAEDLKTSKNIAVKAGHGVGKLVSAHTPVWTPGGFVLAANLEVGDEVLDETGQTTRITALSPLWDRPEYLVTFDDGSTVKCGPEHEWNVLDLSRRTAAMKRGVSDWREHWDDTRTYETQQLVREGLTTASGQRRWRIPLAQPVQGDDAQLPIDPYLLGFWLGDGTTTTGEITIGVTKAPLEDWLRDRGIEYRIRSDWDNGRATITPKDLRVNLRELGVLGNKHIPVSYLTASESQRRELLAGLMDSDGFLLKSENGADVGIDMTNRQLTDDVYTLLMTLGCKVRRSEGVAAHTLDGERHTTGTRYRLNWTPLSNPFKIRGQNWRAPNAQRSRHTQRTIVSIEPTGGRILNFCITVDSPRHLFLAGDSLIPTHNSLLVSALIAWWVDTRYPHAFVASTAPSTAQIGAIVWRELRRLYSLIEKRYLAGEIDHKLPGKINSDTKNNEWKDETGQLIGFGRKPPEGKEDDNFQGIHDGHVLAIGDEAVGLSKEIIDAVSNITSNRESPRIIIANPTNPASYMGKIFRENNEAWSKHTISVFDSPNFTEERHTLDPLILAKLTDQSYVEDKKKEYGENSARYKARVLGEFAFDIGNALIVQDDVSTGYDTQIEPSTETLPELGVDVARFGEDSTQLYLYHDGHLRHVARWEKTSATESVSRIHKHALDNGVRVVKMDGSGLGGPMVDQLVELAGDKYLVVAMMGSGASPDNHKWHNARAYWWDNFRERLRNGEIDLDPEDETLSDELMSVEYKFQIRGGLLIESKDDMRKRGFKSPDAADAAIYAAADIDYLVGDPLAEAGLQPGDHVVYVDEFIGQRDFIGF